LKPNSQWAGPGPYQKSVTFGKLANGFSFHHPAAIINVH
jgi:hypothetical protein